MVADHLQGDFGVEPIVVERFNYGKLVVGPEQRVPPGTEYSITSRSKDLSDIVVRALIPWMSLEPDAITQASRDQGCLIIKRVLFGSNPANGNRCVIMRARYRREGGDGGGGRPYLQSTVWMLPMDVWVQHAQSLMRDHVAELRAVPDKVGSPSRVDPLSLDVSGVAARTLDDVKPDQLPAVLELLWSIRQSQKTPATLVMGTEWCKTEAEFLECAGTAFSLAKGGSVLSGLDVALGLRSTGRGTWFAYRPGEEFPRRPVAKRDDVARWLGTLQGRSSSFLARLRDGATATRDIDPVKPRGVAPSAPRDAAPPPAPPQPTEGPLVGPSTAVEDPPLPAAPPAFVDEGSYVREAEGLAPLRKSPPGQADLERLAFVQGSDRNLADIWVGLVGDFSGGELGAAEFLTKADATILSLKMLDDRSRSKARGSLGTKEEILLDLVASGLGHEDHWTKLTLERAAHLLGIGDRDDGASASIVRDWRDNLASALSTWFAELGVLTPSENIRLQECRILALSPPSLTPAVAEASRRSATLRRMLEDHKTREDVLLRPVVNFIKHRYDLLKRTGYARYSFDPDKHFRSGTSEITYEVAHQELDRIKQTLNLNGPRLL